MCFNRLIVCVQKLVMDDLTTFWATDTRYTAFSSRSRCKRRSIFQITGSEDVDVTLPDGSREKRRTSLCCQTVCFFTITGVQQLLITLNRPLPEEMRDDVVDDGITFMLLRYFSPHPLAHERDTEYRPVCPGPLRLNHCLWKFAKSARCRLAMCNADGTPNANFLQQGHLFGNTQTQRDTRFENEKFAYFGVLTTRCIKRTVNMTQEFSGSGMDFSDTWIETVTLI